MSKSKKILLWLLLWPVLLIVIILHPKTEKFFKITLSLILLISCAIILLLVTADFSDQPKYVSVYPTRAPLLISRPPTATPTARPTVPPTIAIARPASPSVPYRTHQIISDSSSCSIKGNQKTMIYHCKNGASYDRLQNNITWFCSPAEARAAGYRPAENMSGCDY